MDLNICKKCEYNCVPQTILPSEDKISVIMEDKQGYQIVFYFEKENKNRKIYQKLFHKDFNGIFCDEIDIKYVRAVLRNLIMVQNNDCPFYAEHLMSDITFHEKRMEFEKRQKKLISLKKKVAKNKKGVILCQDDQQQKTITM
jgi:hypothetical protein